ncbi:MAG: hypothetical protein GXO07_02830 [Crenarchaeota archaeon]|nr:hypothetical protein [Thermoproteota archaeon]
MWKWKLAFWLTVFAVPPALGSLLDSALGLPKIPYGWILGAPLLATSLLVSSAAGRALRKRGHSRPSRRFTPPDLLVKDGLYSCMRHPNQFSMTLIPLALSLIAGSPCGLALSGWAAASGLAFILYVEERLVHKAFCPDYCDYASRVPAISLNPRCLLVALRELRSSSRPRRG